MLVHSYVRRLKPVPVIVAVEVPPSSMNDGLTLLICGAAA